MDAEQKYRALQADLKSIEDRTGLYLADENVDRENVAYPSDDPFGQSGEVYETLYFVACNAAGFRAEEAGFDINKLLGKVIY